MLRRCLTQSLATKSVRYVILSVLTLTLFLGVWTYHGSSFGTEQTILPLSIPRPSMSATAHGLLDQIQNATLGFQHIVAINLLERTDHKDGLILAAAVSNISIEFIEGVHDESVSPNALPSFHKDGLAPGIIGNWRAHVNALLRVIEEGWSTALILEDDVDWDIRLHSLLRDFAISSSYLLQGDQTKLTKTRLQDIKSLKPPKSSPYGDGWDVIWLGHCGMEIPDDLSIVIHEKDQSVSDVTHLKSWDEKAISPLKDYPPHTRLVMHQKEGVCSLAYAVSQFGARKLLYNVGLQRLEGAFDIMLRHFYEGIDGEDAHVCLSVLPQMFDHHRRVGSKDADSDISPSNGHSRQRAYTYDIRQSVRMNMARILRVNTDYIDQWPESAAHSVGMLI